jgi:hypothetical protein
MLKKLILLLALLLCFSVSFLAMSGCAKKEAEQAAEEVEEAVPEAAEDTVQVEEAVE